MHERFIDLWVRFFYEITHILMTSTMAILFPVRATGMRCVPKKGPLLIVANHQSFLDPVVIGLCTPRRPRYIARSTLFRFLPFRLLILSLGAIPIRQEGSAAEGLKAGLFHLRANGALVVWPEGSRSPDGKLGPLQPGVMVLLKRSQVPVVVAGIAGAFESMPIGHAAIAPTPICVHFQRWDYDPDADRDENLVRMEAAIAEAMRHAERLRGRMLAIGRGSFLDWRSRRIQSKSLKQQANED